ncbi:MAG: malonic semialdehyde reductase [Actinobacteria bacterium]|nr:malonic semialdehyde reductase [Actinomycetota bacterium]
MTITLEPTAAIDERTADLLFRDARTVYSFTDQPVSEAQLSEVYDLMKWAPTAMNSQPLRIVLVRSDDARARLLPHLAEGNRPKAASAPIVAILAADTRFHENLPRLLPQAPGAKDLFADEERREHAARFNATLQAGYFILAVRAAGLHAGPMGGFDAVGVDHDLLGDGPLKSIMIVNIGHPAEGGTFPRNPRLTSAEVVTTL